jgi:hypothetical protein
MKFYANIDHEHKYKFSFENLQKMLKFEVTSHIFKIVSNIVEGIYLQK